MKIFCGYAADAEFLKQDYKTFVASCKGRLIIAIGEGNFTNEFHSVMQQAMAWGAYNNEKNK
jgi:hypothetical protein